VPVNTAASRTSGAEADGLACVQIVAQTRHVDVRVKTFIVEAAKRLDFLHEHGFTGPEADDSTGGVYPLLRRVRYQRDNVIIEASLVLSYMGEEYVATTLAHKDRSGASQRTEIASNTAHTGYQMRRALDRQADALRELLSRTCSA
jgi:hypothetical protein